MKKINIFCFGFGQVAKYFIYNLSKNYHVNFAVTSREISEKKKIFGINYKNYHFLDNNFDKIILSEIKNYDHILLSIPPKNGEDIVFKNFRKILEKIKIKWITYLSATSVYGDHQGNWVNEESKVNPSTDNGKSRLSAEKVWIEFSKDKKIPLQVFRLSGIYSDENNIFKKIQSDTQNIVNKPNNFFSRIHVEDIANILKVSLQKKINIPGEIFNLSDDYPCSNIEVANYAYNLMGVEKPKMIDVNKIKNEMLKNFYKESKKVSNKKIKEIFSYKLKYPTYKEGLRKIFDNSI